MPKLTLKTPISAQTKEHRGQQTPSLSPQPGQTHETTNKEDQNNPTSANQQTATLAPE